MQTPRSSNFGSADGIPDGIPKIIGPFRIVRLLGEGGMGSVYLGERVEEFSQQVAIKILHPSLFPAIVERKIEREGQLLTSLDHPGIVRMLDQGVTADGLHYIVMAYVDGRPLDVFCDERRLTLRRRIEILLEVFDAVEDAHRHLAVHADLKPENILVTAEGKPLLLDFGVAAMLSEMGVPDQAQEEERGEYTALYASPEQRAGERLTVGSDIYSLGVIARSILTGVRPLPLPVGTLHRSAASPATMKKLCELDSNSRTAIAALRSTTSRALITAIRGDIEAILDKALKIDAQERFLSVQELREEFGRNLLGYPIRTRAAGRVTRVCKWMLRNKLAAALGCVLLSAALFSILGVARESIDAARERRIAQTRLRELVRLTDALAGDIYGSVQGLEGAETAQAALLESAHRTVDQLAADDSGDEQLNLELAMEYEKLARLELSRRPFTPEAERQFDDDRNKELAILNRLKPNDPQVLLIRARLPQR